MSPGREAEHENDLPKAIRKSELDETVKGGPKYLLLFMLAHYSARDKGRSANVSCRSDLTRLGNPASSRRNPTSALSVTATRATGTKPQLRRAASGAQIHADIVIRLLVINERVRVISVVSAWNHSRSQKNFNRALEKKIKNLTPDNTLRVFVIYRAL